MVSLMELDSKIDELVHGAIDTHIHFAPDPNFVRRLNALDTARNAEEVGLRAIVLKSSDYPTAPLATIINPLLTDTTVYGSITINYAVGLNPYAVECSGKLGAKIIWMPTIASTNCPAEEIGSFLGADIPDEGIPMLDDEGELRREFKDIIDIAKQYDMVVASGHTSPKETFKMVEFAQEIGIWKVVATHVSSVGGGGIKETLTLAEQQELAGRGVFLEHVLCGMMPTFQLIDPQAAAKAIKTVGAEKCIISSDLGQAYHCPPAEGMRMLIGIMLRLGIEPGEIEFMAKKNPARLLGI